MNLSVENTLFTEP